MKVDGIPIVDAPVVHYLLLQPERNHTPGSYRLDHLVVSVYVIIGDAVADDETLQVVGLIELLVHFLNEVPLVNLPC